MPKFLPFILNSQRFGSILLMGDRSVLMLLFLMHYAVGKPQLAATYTVLSLLYDIQGIEALFEEAEF